MKRNNQENGIVPFLKRNWFKVLIGSLLLILFLKKDFSFQINMQAPDSTKQPTPTVKQKKEVLTEQQTASLSTRDRLGLLFSEKTDNKPKLIDALHLLPQELKTAYLKRFAHVAIAERKKFGIPTSIILANALLQSTAGTAGWSKASNNQFGMNCDTWTNATYKTEEHCYRQYENAWASFRDHSLHLSSEHFASLQKLGEQDYKGWATGLQKTGFSKDKNYAQNLISIIESYSLHQLDSK